MIASEDLRKLARDLPQDENERRELYNTARPLYMSLETPTDAFSRDSLSVSDSTPSTEVEELRLWQALSECQAPVRAEELVTKIKADSVLLERILRYLACFGLTKTDAGGLYLANDTTRYLAQSGKEGGIKHYFRNHMPIMQVLLDYLRKNTYENPSDGLNTAFQRAHNTTSHAYSWTPSDPTVLEAFHAFLKSQTGRARDWTSAVSTDSMKLSDDDIATGRVLFCDIGGGSGSQCVNFRKNFPELVRKVVLQDQESVISKIEKTELVANDIEVQTHDFFQEQPVKGAKTCFLRYIMHDWADVKCLQMLAQLKAAISQDSGASWKQVQIDIQMMAALASMERSESQWRLLPGKAGLKVKSIFTYGDDESGKSMITAVAA